MKDVCIVGIGETKPTRVSDQPVDRLVLQAVDAALEDAGIAPSEVNGLVSDGIYGPRAASLQRVAAHLGQPDMWTASRSVGGAAIMSAPELAAEAIASGKADVVVFYFAMDGGSRQGGPYSNHNRFGAKAHFERPYGFTGQPLYFATWARRYLAEFPGSESALGTIAVSASENAAATGRAQRPKPLSQADYQDSPLIADPLRLRDCCVISDGAGAYVMTSRARARDCRKRPVQVLASTLASPPVSGDAAFTQFGDLLTLPGASEAAQRAFAIAGIRHDDLSFAQIYDCFTISCLLQLEDLGFCDKGEGADFVRDGRISRSGALPINTHGGFLAYSYLLGVDHVVEAVRQLRGEAGAGQLPDPRIALVSGLSMPDYGVLLLAAD